MSEPERWVSGLQPVREVIRVHRDGTRKVLVEEGQKPKLEAVARFARDQGIPVERVPRATLDRLSGGAAHQGVMAVAPPLELASSEALLSDPEPARDRPGRSAGPPKFRGGHPERRGHRGRSPHLG